MSISENGARQTVTKHCSPLTWNYMYEIALLQSPDTTDIVAG